MAVLTGTAGDDILGGAGADQMFGGLGNDYYIVNDAGDVADETGGDGTDTVQTNIDWTLGVGLENLILGNGALIGTGNALNNVITGNSQANTLYGLDGDDTLNGGGGADSLYGGIGADSLDGGSQDDFLDGGDGDDTLNGGTGHDYLRGGAGADAMIGGAGNDFYAVDDAGDSVSELANGGTDTVQARMSYTLGANVERLILGAAGQTIDGTGNASGNVITGNSYANTLSGLDGGDVLNGGGARDTLYGGNGNDTLNGGNQDDLLFGGNGQDQLTGGSGGDTFAFTDLDVHLSGSAGISDLDQILDLSFAARDIIDLSSIDADSVTGGDQAFTFVSAFSQVAGQAVMSFSGGITTLSLDIDGDGVSDLRIAINGDVTGTGANLYTGSGDSNGGWVL